jgi:5-hydroxyisourate hydrolase
MADSPQGRLTTHVLDIARGRPAPGIAIELRRAGEPEPLARAVTNADGRTDAPLLAGADHVAGEYEITFQVGEYLAAEHGTSQSPPFLQTIPIRFGIADAGAHLHVPLLLAPHGYSTYRGS